MGHIVSCPLVALGRPTYAGPVTVDMQPQVSFHADMETAHVSQGTRTHTRTIPHCLAQRHNILALISVKLSVHPPDSPYGGDKGVNCLAWEEVKAGNSCQLCWTRPGGGHADWHVESPASKLATKARALCGPWV